MTIDVQRMTGRNQQPLGSLASFATVKAVLEIDNQRWLRTGIVDTDIDEYPDLKEAGLLNMAIDTVGLPIRNTLLSLDETLIDRVQLSDDRAIYLTSVGRLMVLPDDSFEPYFLPLDAPFAAKQIEVVVGTDYITVRGANGTVGLMVSEDMGVTWRTSALEAPFSNLTYVTQDIWIAWEDAGTVIYRTLDRGVTWSEIAIAPGDSIGHVDMSPVSKTLFYVTPTNSVKRTLFANFGWGEAALAPVLGATTYRPTRLHALADGRVVLIMLYTNDIYGSVSEDDGASFNTRVLLWNPYTSSNNNSGYREALTPDRSAILCFYSPSTGYGTVYAFDGTNNVTIGGGGISYSVNYHWKFNGSKTNKYVLLESDFYFSGFLIDVSEKRLIMGYQGLTEQRNTGGPNHLQIVRSDGRGVIADKSGSSLIASTLTTGTVSSFGNSTTSQVIMGTLGYVDLNQQFRIGTKLIVPVANVAAKTSAGTTGLAYSTDKGRNWFIYGVLSVATAMNGPRFEPVSQKVNAGFTYAPGYTTRLYWDQAFKQVTLPLNSGYGSAPFLASDGWIYIGLAIQGKLYRTKDYTTWEELQVRAGVNMSSRQDLIIEGADGAIYWIGSSIVNSTELTVHKVVDFSLVSSTTVLVSTTGTLNLTGVFEVEPGQWRVFAYLNGANDPVVGHSDDNMQTWRWTNAQLGAPIPLMHKKQRVYLTRVGSLSVLTTRNHVDKYTDDFGLTSQPLWAVNCFAERHGDDVILYGRHPTATTIGVISLDGGDSWYTLPIQITNTSEVQALYDTVEHYGLMQQTNVVNAVLLADRFVQCAGMPTALEHSPSAPMFMRVM